MKALTWEKVKEAYARNEKHDRYGRLSEIKKELLEALKAEAGGDAARLAALALREKEVKGYYEDVKYDYMRRMITEERRRIGGRGEADIRKITCEVGLLPRVHGSALFTRGETQALVATTLGTAEDEQRIEQLTGMSFKKFMLHYNFPPFSVGEAKFLRGPGRREIGHGVLAERALRQVLPPEDKFPYTVRIVSDIMESNGSSSMASVCGGCLSLMDAGVPIKAPVAGIAMGLIKEGREDRHPLRHPRRRGPPRRHGLQGLRHRRRHHLHPDGHQDRRRDPGDPGARARPGPRRPAAHPRRDGEGHLRPRARRSASTRRASPPSRSVRSASRTSSAPAAR